MKKQIKTIVIGEQSVVFLPWISGNARYVRTDRELWLRRWNLPGRLLFKLGLLSAERIFAFHLKPLLRRCEKIIVLGHTDQRLLLHPVFLKKRRTKTYLYCWDTFKSWPNLREHLAPMRERFTVYSFDPVDCKTYGLHYNPTMYIDILSNPLDCSNILYDVVFVGSQAGRVERLRQFYTGVCACGLVSLMHITVRSSDTQMFEKLPGWHITDQYIPYPEYLQYVQQSRAILDVCQKGQVGYTLRVMEHIFFGKKLITDNAVIKEAEFYHPNNIFLLQERNIEELKDWLDLPFVPISEEIKEYYKFENWAERFV